MCGICGAVFADRERVMDEGDLLAMRDALAHRGPDDAGSLLAPGVALGSRRLAIVDLSAHGHMPMSTDDSRYTMVYNGEVYNYRELRSSLIAAGHRFRSNTDTEVLLQLFATRGPAMLDALNGMFAIAVWDARERTLFLARDRVGVKPLYYTSNEGTLCFASEQKALFAAGIRPRFDPTTWAELLCFRFTAGEVTPFDGVRRLLPGHYLIWRDGNVRVVRWWHLAERAAALRESAPDEAAEWLQETFDDAVRLRRISDVPLGVLLSGGLDSGTVAAALARQAGAGAASFTVRFDEPGYDEGSLARQVADRWHLDYHDLKVQPSELPALLRDASRLNDEPLAHGNELYLWAISAYAKRVVTVLLSGEGADETLSGYVRYRPLRHPTLLGLGGAVAAHIPTWLVPGGRARKLKRLLALGSSRGAVLYNACDALPVDLVDLGMAATGRFAYREHVLAEAQGLYPDTLVRQAMYLDQHTFLCSLLDRNDRMTMGASIECRVPFLDYRLVEMLAALPDSRLLDGGPSKPLLRRALGDRLPAALQRQPKWGFGVPWAGYLRTVPQLRDIVSRLPTLAPLRDGPFDARKLQRLVADFLNGATAGEALVRQFVMIAIWHQACVDGAVRPSRTPAAALAS